MIEKMTALKMTAQPSKYQTEAESSTTLTRWVNEIAVMIDTVQPTHLPSAKLFGQTSKKVISKHTIKFCAANHIPEVPESQRTGRQAKEKTELGDNALGPGRLSKRNEELALGN